MENRYKISYDMKTRSVFNIKFKQGDIDSSVLEVSLLDGSLPVNITGEVIEFRFLKSDKTIVYQDSTTGVSIIDAATGKMQCILKSNTLSASGIVTCEIHRSLSGKGLTTPSFHFTVESSVGEGGFLSSNYISAVENKIIEWQTEFDANEAARNVEFEAIKTEYNTYKNVMIDASPVANLQSQINVHTSDLADIPNKIEIQNFKSNINKFGIKQKPFFNFRRALLKNSNVIFTFWGDSISTDGDKLNLNSSTPSGTDYAPNGIVNSEGYTHLITNEIVKSFPTKKFNFYNRAIGGETLESWNSQKTFNSVTKTWIEHINDTQPDVLFIGFGMNHNSYDSTSTFASNLKKVYDYIYANFTKIPDIVLVTSPTCVCIEGNATWSDDKNQETRRNTGKVARYFGIQYADYILDVSRFSDISRFGKDLENIYFEEKAITTTGLINLKNNGEMLTTNENCRDFTLKFTLTANNVTDGEFVLLRFNRVIDGIDINNQIAIYPNLSGKTTIRGYGHISDISNFPTYQTSEYIHNSVQTAIYFRIEKKGKTVKVFMGDIPEAMVICDDKFDINNVNGLISFTKQGGSISTINILSLQYFEAKYTECQKSITEDVMWGKYIDGNYTTKPITGGNGANHPSSKGIALCYGIPIYEMIKDINSLTKQNSELDLELEKKDIAFGADALTFPGYCYENIPGVLFLQGTVKNNDNTINLKQNRKCISFDKRTILADDEFGIYNTGGMVQIVFKNTMGATGYASPFKFNTYQFM